MKPFDTATTLALGKRRAAKATLIQFVLDEGTFGFWTRSGDFVYQGVTYRGAGKFISLETVSTAGNFAVTPITVKLSSIPDAALTPDVLGTVFDYTWHQRPAVIYDAYIDPDTRAVIKVERIARRLIDTIEMIEAVDGAAQLVARLMPLNFDNPNRGYFRYGNSDQRLIDPDDGYFKFSATAGTVQIEWGRAPSAPGGVGSPQGVGG
jgi:hypothetical protein